MLQWSVQNIQTTKIQIIKFNTTFLCYHITNTVFPNKTFKNKIPNKSLDCVVVVSTASHFPYMYTTTVMFLIYYDVFVSCRSIAKNTHYSVYHILTCSTTLLSFCVKVQNVSVNFCVHITECLLTENIYLV